MPEISINIVFIELEPATGSIEASSSAVSAIEQRRRYAGKGIKVDDDAVEGVEKSSYWSHDTSHLG